MADLAGRGARARSAGQRARHGSHRGDRARVSHRARRRLCGG